MIEAINSYVSWLKGVDFSSHDSGLVNIQIVKHKTDKVMASPLFGISVFRRRSLVILLCATACFYLLISIISSYMTVKQLSQPPYTLKNAAELENIQKPILSSKGSSGELWTNVSQMKFLPSFFITSDMLNKVIQRDSYVSRTLLSTVNSPDLWSNHSIFDCICGRVSDACTCCGPLKNPMDHLQVFNKPLVLFAEGDHDPATLCVNITYLPKKQEVKMTGFLTPTLQTTLSKDFKSQELHHKTSNFNSLRMLVLYDSQFVPLRSPPSICADNSKEDPKLMLCAQLSALHYGVESTGDHQTAFKGCLEVMMLVERRWTIARYPKVCFQAHRGAAGDVDLAAAVAKKADVDSPKTTVPTKEKQASVVPLPPLKADNAAVAGNRSDMNNIAIKESKVQVPFSLNAAHPGVP